jgi:hypothetical protein
MFHLQDNVTFPPNSVTPDYTDSSILIADFEYMALDET